MTVIEPNILISGAGIAGPIVAYWLRQFGFSPTVVERAPALRVGGHPVDLWGSAVEVVERMGVLPEIEAASTRNDVGVMLAEGHRPVEIDLKRLVVEIADQHIEIMRGRLVSVLYERNQSGCRIPVREFNHLPRRRRGRRARELRTRGAQGVRPGNRR